MVVAFTVIQINYLVVCLFSMCCCLFPIYICGIKFLLWQRCLFCFRHSDKSGFGFPKIIHHILVGAHQAEIFSKKYSIYNQFYKLLLLGFYFDFLLNLGFYYKAVENRHKYRNRQHISIRKYPCFIICTTTSPERGPLSNVGIESVGSAGQTGVTY